LTFNISVTLGNKKRHLVRRDRDVYASRPTTSHNHGTGSH